MLVVGAGVLLLFAANAWAFTLTLPFTGADAWPIFVQAERAITDPGILAKQRYLEGLWDGGVFWRPGLVAFAGMERLAFGDNPAPYHVVRLLLAWLTACVIGYAASHRGAWPGLAFILAGATYLLHPLQAETLPVTARDADSLVSLIGISGLTLLAGARFRKSRAWLVCGSALALAAPLVKEPGLVLPLAGVLALRPWDRRTPRVTAALLSSTVLLTGLVGHVGYRLALLGTVGGYRAGDPAPAEPPILTLMRALFDHQRWGLLATATGMLVLAVTISGVTRNASSSARPEWSGIHAAMVAWVAAGALTLGLSDVSRERYAEMLLVPLAVLLGGFAAGMFETARPRWRPFCAAALFIAIVLSLGPGSPLVWRYPQWEIAGRVSTAVLEASQRALTESTGHTPASVRVGRFQVTASRGQDAGPAWLSIDPFPLQPEHPAGWRTGRVANVYILAPYAVEAYLLARGHQPSAVRVQAGAPLLGVRLSDLAAR
ncbi:MAG: hypothetical protein KBA95_17020 [Acidobacteria bacterium]|nr:hypothetical protein [Acidobacteriota bacterium]